MTGCLPLSTMTARDKGVRLVVAACLGYRPAVQPIRPEGPEVAIGATER